MSGELAIFDRNQSDPRDAELKELREENKRLARALADANVRAERAQEDAERALLALRRQLTPLYRALQAVFGELDAADVRDDGIDPRWQSWMAKMPGKPAEFIDVLLEHGEMTAAQLKVACKCSSDTVYQTIHKLNKAGLVNKNSGRFSLKQL